MNIIFKRLVMHNFLSYRHTEIDLTSKNYCLVKGVNNNLADGALSNGSGKSSWSSAICWALTGETVSGLTSNIKNINIDENECYVTLEFSVDKNNYVIQRIKNPKSDLKISLNGEDISGKGIKDSEIILAKHIPDLTSQLLCSIIILGQGLPNKFTRNSPSGRKEVLEQLSKSDFMIADLKERITNRLSILEVDLRSIEDTILSDTSKKDVTAQQIKLKENEINELSIPKDFDTQILTATTQINEKVAALNSLAEKLNTIRESELSVDKELNALREAKLNALNIANSVFNTYNMQNTTNKLEADNNINNLKRQLNELKEIKDICPTCGQRLPNVIKPDPLVIEDLNKRLNEALTDKQTIETALTTHIKLYEDKKAEINKSYDKDISDAMFKIKQIKDTINVYSNGINAFNKEISALTNKINLLKLEKEHLNTNLLNAKAALNTFIETEKSLLDKILYNNNVRDTLTEHIKVVNKLNTLIKRDFRGYLLSDVINYISAKTKEYAKEVFGNDNLEFKLNGNNIDITYCEKAFENLSGGEQQKVDIIIQFAIRDMMEKYLDFSSNILILDEILDALDNTSSNAVLDFISKECQDVESLFFISHHADELQIPYDCQMIVTKNNQGISDIKFI